MADIALAVAFVNERVGQPNRGLAVIGFSLGANFALDLAEADPEHIRSVVLFYGTGGNDFSHSRAAYLGHFAENDEFEPQASVDELEAPRSRAGRPVTFYRYSGTGHWFFEPDRHQAYNHGGCDPGMGSNHSLPTGCLHCISPGELLPNNSLKLTRRAGA